VWHVPAVLTMAVHSNTWHLVQHASFLVTGLLFWWPVVQPRPSAPTEPQWWIVLYLFLATLPCDVLAALLVFSERLAYPVYLVGSGRSAASVLADQEYAGALMWTCVTIIYVMAGVIVSIRLLVWPRAPRPTALGLHPASPVSLPRDSRVVSVRSVYGRDAVGHLSGTETDQAVMKTPGSFRSVLVPRGSSKREWLVRRNSSVG